MNNMNIIVVGLLGVIIIGVAILAPIWVRKKNIDIDQFNSIISKIPIIMTIIFVSVILIYFLKIVLHLIIRLLTS